MPVLPYLHFQGQCAAAMAFYAETFGGTDLRIAYYTQGDSFADDTSGRIMHSQLMLDGTPLFASDYPPGQEGDPQKAVSITYTHDDFERGKRLYAALADGGTQIVPYGPTGFVEGFGMVTDRFGTNWILMAGAPRQGD